MSEDQSADATIDRAEAALRLMSDPQMVAAFAAVEAAIMDAMLECKAEDDAGRYRLSEAAKSCRRVKQILQQTIETGQVAAGQLRELTMGRKRAPWSIVR